MEKYMNEQTVLLKNHDQQKRRYKVVGLNGKYECESCNKTFSHRSNLYQHIHSKHEGIKYACDKCDYQATQQGNLSKHIQSKHEGVKYACDQCDYQATFPSNLRTHIRKHH